MQPRFETLSSKIIAGKKIGMSFSQNKTAALWQSFMPQRAAIKNKVDKAFYSVEVYPDAFFERFKPDAEFEKWAGVEVSDNTESPADIELLEIPAGLYAIFLHRGPASTGPKTYQYIFGVCLPDSAYQLDNRPHFAVMTEKYKHEQADSEEEIFIPVKPR